MGMKVLLKQGGRHGVRVNTRCCWIDINFVESLITLLFCDIKVKYKVQIWCRAYGILESPRDISFLK